MTRKKLWVGGLTLVLALVLSGVAYGALGDRLLSRGSNGPEVTELQKRLVQLGYPISPLNGNYGSKTQAAVRKFQQDHGLKVDGLAGPETITELKRLTRESTTATGKPVGPKNVDVNLLARAVSAEARGEPYKGQVAVAAVILNRMKDPAYPKTVADIVYQPKAFSSVDDGQINQAPTASAVKAAHEAVNGSDPTHGALFFFNPAKTSNKYIWSRPQILQIGNHIFTR